VLLLLLLLLWRTAAVLVRLHDHLAETGIFTIQCVHAKPGWRVCVCVCVYLFHDVRTVMENLENSWNLKIFFFLAWKSSWKKIHFLNFGKVMEISFFQMLISE